MNNATNRNELKMMIDDVIAESAERGHCIDKDAIARVLRLLASVTIDADLVKVADLYERLSGADASRGGPTGI